MHESSYKSSQHKFNHCLQVLLIRHQCVAHAVSRTTFCSQMSRRVGMQIWHQWTVPDMLERYALQPSVALVLEIWFKRGHAQHLVHGERVGCGLINAVLAKVRRYVVRRRAVPAEWKQSLVHHPAAACEETR